MVQTVAPFWSPFDEKRSAAHSDYNQIHVSTYRATHTILKVLLRTQVFFSEKT